MKLAVAGADHGYALANPVKIQILVAGVNCRAGEAVAIGDIVQFRSVENADRRHDGIGFQVDAAAGAAVFIPSAADRVGLFDDGERDAGLLQADCGAHAGYAGADIRDMKGMHSGGIKAIQTKPQMAGVGISVSSGGEIVSADIHR